MKSALTEINFFSILFFHKYYQPFDLSLFSQQEWDVTVHWPKHVLYGLQVLILQNMEVIYKDCFFLVLNAHYYYNLLGLKDGVMPISRATVFTFVRLILHLVCANSERMSMTFIWVCQNWATSWQNQHNDFAPSEDSDQLGIHPVWSESSLSAWRNIRSSANYWAHCEDWSDWADAQADLSLGWAHRSFCWFCHEALQLFIAFVYSSNVCLCCSESVRSAI